MEGAGGNALEDEPAAGVLPRLGVDAEGIVDVAGAEAHRPHHLAAEIKGVQGLL